jgi:ubiquinone/menaquinone biosynthesis C-methylase UbiE
MDTEQERETGYVLGHSPQELERLIAQARLYEPLARRFFREAGIVSGMRVLDVGCGAGDVSFLLARLVGLTGQVVGVDRAAEAVLTASRRARHHELPNTRFVKGEAGDLVDQKLFDAVVGRWVLMFCPDPVAVLRQVVGARPSWRRGRLPRTGLDRLPLVA